MRLRLSIVALVLSACGLQAASYRATQTGSSALTPKPANCDFAILTTTGSRPYEEIAILDSKNYMAHDVAEFKEAIKKDVCELGGDAVLAQVNGYGYYPRGTVLRWTEAK
jgi:hypothetical protein